MNVSKIFFLHDFKVNEYTFRGSNSANNILVLFLNVSQLLTLLQSFGHSECSSIKGKKGENLEGKANRKSQKFLPFIKMVEKT